MPRGESANCGTLCTIERELARTGLRIGFRDSELEQSFQSHRRNQGNRHNWWALALMALVVDLSLGGEIRFSPEVTTLAVIDRLLLTPAVCAYILLDRADRLGRLAGPLLALLLILPTGIISAECYSMASKDAALLNFPNVPLLQVVLLTHNLTIRQAAAIAVLSCVLYCTAVLTAPHLPPAAIPTMLLVDLGIALANGVFLMRMDTRERQVFLLNRQATIAREMLAEQNVELARLSQADALTGLGNRRCFDQTLAALWSEERRRARPVTLILFDIDCFKLFNDRYGHQAGDECLAMLARAVSRCMRDERDTLVRYGGEEFAVILAETSVQEGYVVAERIRLAVAGRAIPHANAGPLPYVTVSLGVASVTPSQQSAAMLIEAADRCLYSAKRAGRNQVATGEDHAGKPPSCHVTTASPAAVPGGL